MSRWLKARGRGISARWAKFLSTIKLYMGGRTGGMLLCAYIWVWLGVGNLNNIQVVRPGVVYLMMPSEARTLMWIIPALLAIVTAWSRRASPIGMGLLMLPAAIVIASYGWSFYLWLAIGPSDGYESAYYQAAVFGALPMLVLYVAARPVPPRRLAIV